jgi:hypothetical protein
MNSQRFLSKLKLIPSGSTIRIKEFSMPIDTVYICKDCMFGKMDVSDTIFTLGGIVGVTDIMFKCTKTAKSAQVITDPVIGHKKVKPEMSFCSVERKYGDCGPNAKNWIPKHKKDLFKMLTKESHD